ncbi:hypothetical protein LCGC14_0771500 [marine sediment metagenome]|uniref:Uncharacterized protein n=1 Tax=marine sediment metagenome TaxID=412755 RepID=A0A0F9QHX2_9ZZZZ
MLKEAVTDLLKGLCDEEILLYDDGAVFQTLKLTVESKYASDGKEIVLFVLSHSLRS